MAELTTLARPYAKAAFQYAHDAKQLAAWAEQLATLAGASRYGAMQRLIASPSLSAEQQAKKLISVCGDAISEPVQRFVTLLAKNKRLALLPEINQLFETLKNNQEQSVNVELVSAVALDEQSQQKIAKALSGKLSREVNVQSSVDKTLLAGVVIKAGDLVIDGSMRGRFEKLAKAINS